MLRTGMLASESRAATPLKNVFLLHPAVSACLVVRKSLWKQPKEAEFSSTVAVCMRDPKSLDSEIKQLTPNLMYFLH